MMKNSELESLINERLNGTSFSDYGPNGLRGIEGRETGAKIITGVTWRQSRCWTEAVQVSTTTRRLFITVTSGKTNRRLFVG